MIARAPPPDKAAVVAAGRKLRSAADQRLAVTAFVCAGVIPAAAAAFAWAGVSALAAAGLRGEGFVAAAGLAPF
jgi:hypothetical protein